MSGIISQFYYTLFNDSKIVKRVIFDFLIYNSKLGGYLA